MGISVNSSSNLYILNMAHNHGFLGTLEKSEKRKGTPEYYYSGVYSIVYRRGGFLRFKIQRCFKNAVSVMELIIRPVITVRQLRNTINGNVIAE